MKIILCTALAGALWAQERTVPADLQLEAARLDLRAERISAQIQKMPEVQEITAAQVDMQGKLKAACAPAYPVQQPVKDKSGKPVSGGLMEWVCQTPPSAPAPPVTPPKAGLKTPPPAVVPHNPPAPDKPSH